MGTMLEAVRKGQRHNGVNKAGWDEALHPRGYHGRWVDSGGHELHVGDRVSHISDLPGRSGVVTDLTHSAHNPPYPMVGVHYGDQTRRGDIASHFRRIPEPSIEELNDRAAAREFPKPDGTRHYEGVWGGYRNGQSGTLHVVHRDENGHAHLVGVAERERGGGTWLARHMGRYGQGTSRHFDAAAAAHEIVARDAGNRAQAALHIPMQPQSGDIQVGV